MADCICGGESGHGQQGDVGGGVVASRSDTPTPAAQAGGGMGVPVTPHAGISQGGGGGCLACGVDSLDVAFYVDWGDAWADLMSALRKGQEQAREANKVVVWRELDSGPVLIFPTGKPPMYRYHLQSRELHLFVSIGQDGEQYANVYASLNAKGLWQSGVRACVDGIEALVKELGGYVRKHVISRCDLCADFLLPDGIPVDFMYEHGVPEDVKHCTIMQGATLETYYVGSSGSSIRARIYDKAKEVLEHQKLWFLDVWKVKECRGVWRVEFQLRREALKRYGVESVYTLMDRLGGMWFDLSTNWYSLRMRDNSNTSRRTVLPFWRAVQDCAGRFGEVVEVKRAFPEGGKADREYYLTRAANLLPGFAAVVGLPDFDRALQEFCQGMRDKWAVRDFHEAFAVQLVRLAGPGMPKAAGGTEDAPF